MITGRQADPGRTRLARTAAAADLTDPARRRSVAAGWELFKRQLHMHHTAGPDGTSCRCGPARGCH
jgi:hypothetical protein